jgi:hypothetical protein
MCPLAVAARVRGCAHCRSETISKLEVRVKTLDETAARQLKDVK